MERNFATDFSFPTHKGRGKVTITVLPSTLTNVIGHNAHGCTEFIMSELYLKKSNSLYLGKIQI